MHCALLSKVFQKSLHILIFHHQKIMLIFPLNQYYACLFPRKWSPVKIVKKDYIPEITQVTFFSLRLYFQSIFRITAKLTGRYRDFPDALPHTCPVSPQDGPFVTTDKPTDTSSSSPRVHSLSQTPLSMLYMLRLEICKMTRIHHNSIIQSIFTALKMLCALQTSIFPPTSFQPLATTDLFLSPQCCFFQIGFLHLVISIHGSSMFFISFIQSCKKCNIFLYYNFISFEAVCV